ncbi:MAG: NAD(P)-dependent oxidoreductase [bacterium]|nr:NAD(P)-dependent oxidoreductase [bacterium]
MKAFPKTLVTGANGMVGSYVDFGIRTGRSELDVTDLAAVLSLVKKLKPKVILHLAAHTNLDEGEKNPSIPYSINTIGTYNMALAARLVKAKLVYISSTGVFDGTKKSPYTEKDIPNPQNYYGHSKYAGELIIQNMLKDYIIARACWMFGGGPKRDKKFVAKIIAQIEKPETKEIKALTDVKGSPTFGKDLAMALKKLIEKDARGVFNLTNNGLCTRFDVAKVIVEILKPSLPVIGVDSNYFNLPAVRIKNESAISRTRLMRPWQEALREYLKTEWL